MESNDPNRRKRVALAIHSLHGGGAERIISQLANRWSHKYDVHLITWASDSSDQYTLEGSIHRIGLDLQKNSRNPIDGLIANIQRVASLRKSLRRIEPDIVVSFCDQMNITCLAASRQFRGLPVWIAEHSDPTQQRLNAFWETWRRLTYHRCTGAVALTKEIGEAMQQWIAAERIRVIPPALSEWAGFDIEYRDSNADGSRAILFVGRLSSEKRLDLLLEAWGSIQAQLAGWRLDIVGDGPERSRLEKMASTLREVRFLGWSNSPSEYYRSSQMFVLCSRYEGFPVALLEALSFGLPCIATQCSSAIGKLVMQGGPQSIRTVPKGSVDCLATAILNLAQDSAQRRRMSVDARKVAWHYTWNTIGPAWDSILEHSS